MTVWTVVSWSLLAAGGLLALVGLVGDRARGRLRCPGGWRRVLWVVPWRRGCWYDMSGQVANDAAVPRRAEAQAGFPVTCPECGRRWKRVRSLRRARPRVWMLALAVLIGLAAYPAAVWPRVRAHGWWAGAPTWVLVLSAPVDAYAQGAITPMGSRPALHPATNELFHPAWDRPISGWEAEILTRRVNGAIRRTPGAAADQAVLVLPLQRVERGDLWSWPKPIALTERVVFGQSLVNAATSVAWRGESDSVVSWRRHRALQLVTGPRGFVADYRAVIESVDRAKRDGILVRRIRASGTMPELEIIAYDVSDISPARLMPAARAGSRAGPVLMEYAIGDPVEDAELGRIRRAVWRIVPDSWPVVGPSVPTAGQFSGALGTLFVRNTRENHERILLALEEIRGALAEPYVPREDVDIGVAGVWARVIDLGWVRELAVDAAVASGAADPEFEGSRALGAAERLIEQAMLAAGQYPATADRVKHVVQLVGTPEQLAAGEAAIERVRAEGLSALFPPGPAQPSP